MYQKLKSLIEQDLIFTSLLLCGIAILAFLLGQASVTSALPGNAMGGTQTATIQQSIAFVPPASDVATTSPNAPVTPSITTTSANGQFVASKSGTKYHLLTCPGAKQIKTENKIYFATAAEAESLGYSKAANCPGL